MAPQRASTDATRLRGAPPWLVAAALTLWLAAQRLATLDTVSLALHALAAGALAAALAIRAREGAPRVLLVAHGGLLSAWGGCVAGRLAGVVEGDGAVVLTVGWLTVLAVSLPTLAWCERAWLSMAGATIRSGGRMAAAAEAGAALGLGLVTLASLNYVASQRDWRKDLSYFRTTMPGAATLSLAARAETPVEALLFLGPVDEVRAALEPYFVTLAASSQGRMTTRIVDHAAEPELARRHKVAANGWVVLHKPNAAASAAAAVAAGDAPSASETIDVGEDLDKARRNLRRLDGMVHKALTRLSRPSRRLSVTTGHGERSRDGSAGEGPEARLDTVYAVWERFGIETDTLGLADGLGQRVPAGTPAVAVIGPRARLLDEEVAALLAYVRQGGRLVVLLDPDVDDGLDGLLRPLGIERLPGVVASERQHMRRSFDAADRAIIYSGAYSSHPTVSSASRNAGRVATILQRAAGLRERRADRLPGVQVHFPLRAPPDAWLERNGNWLRDADEIGGTIELMAAVTVPIDATATAAPAAGGRAAGEGRVVILGDGDAIGDGILPNAGNALPWVDTLRWLLGDEDVSSEIESEEDVAIEHRKDEDRWWFYATTFGLPLPLLVVAWWRGRRLRRGRRAPDEEASQP